MTGSTPSALPRSCCDGLLLPAMQRARSEEGKNYVLHFLKWPPLHQQQVRSPWNLAEYAIGESQSHGGKNTKSDGSDPTFWRSIRPKVRGVAPVLRGPRGAEFRPRLAAGGCKR